MLFPPHVLRADQQVHLDAVKNLGASFERATDRLVAVDVPPGASSYEAIIALLTNLEAADVVTFETCEARRVDDFGVDDQDVAAEQRNGASHRHEPLRLLLLPIRRNVERDELRLRQGEIVRAFKDVRVRELSAGHELGALRRKLRLGVREAEAAREIP